MPICAVGINYAVDAHFQLLLLRVTHVWVSLWTSGVSRFSTGMHIVELHHCKVLPELIISDEVELMLQGVVHYNDQNFTYVIWLVLWHGSVVPILENVCKECLALHTN